MMHERLRQGLCRSADTAFFTLMGNVQHMLSIIDTYLEKNSNSEDLPLIHKCEELKSSVIVLGSLPKLLADELKARSHGEPRVRTKLGVELYILNEFEAHLTALILFFVSERAVVYPYDHIKVREALSELRSINRMLE